MTILKQKEMVNYDNGKIYKIEGAGKVYIGSTTKKYLSQRWGNHKYGYIKKVNKTTAWTLFDEIGIDNCSISLIELYPCNTIDELRARERYYIENTPNCINRCTPGKTHEEWQKEHSIENNDNAKKWYVENKEKRSSWAKSIIECECGISFTKSNKARHLKIHHA